MTNPDGTKQLSATKAFECEILRFQHTSTTLANLPAIFSVILPPGSNLPVLYWLSGLTCTDQNFIIKAGAAQYAAKHSVAIVCPDTSPRGAGAPREDDSWEFGTGAGFYVNATSPGYEAYQMADYVVRDLPEIVANVLEGRVDASRKSIFGHSMGGMGALSLALRNPDMYTSVSALAPIGKPTETEIGQNAYRRYLGDDMEAWKAYDPSELMKKRRQSLVENILIHQGTHDEFKDTLLLPNTFVEACEKAGQKVEFLWAEGYDHSYFFVQTFVGQHVEFHAKALNA